MFRRSLLALLLWLATGTALAHPPPVFFVSADSPYNKDELPRLATLYQEAGSPTFLAHLGDIKSGITDCEDSHYTEMAGLFRSLPVPMVFSPGDNDWTDCRRLVAGDYEPGERLARLRELMFADPDVLRLQGLRIHRPAALANAYPELFWFRYGHVLFINWHVVGSGNNRLPDDPDALKEYRDRTRANAQLTAAALKGYKGYMRALVIFSHAGMFLGEQVPPRGYRPMHRLLTELLERTKAPVLLIHGDDHIYKTDQPWLGRPQGERLWRLGLPGHPLVAGVKVEFVKDKRQPFRFTYLDSPAMPSPTVNRRLTKPGRRAE